MIDSVLELRDFTVYRGPGRKVLDIGELTIRRQELVAVVGPNGTGKSTLLQAVNLLLPHRGQLRLFGQESGETAATLQRRRSAMVFQETLLLRGTVFHNLALPLRFRGEAASEIKPKVLQALKDFRCDHLADRQARSLSGGEAQRVAIARALVTDPELLLLDEPFASLDATMRGEMIEEIRQLAVMRGLTVLLVSHDFTDVVSFADRVIAVFAGSIVQDAPPVTLLRRPATENVARLTGMDNIFPCRVEQAGPVRLINLANRLSFPCPENVPSSVQTCCIPGDAFSPAEANRPAEDGAEIAISGVVERVLPGIGFCRVVVLVGGLPLVARLPLKAMNIEIRPGAAVTLVFDPTAAHFIEPADQ
jgi:tungstate transport system ATP-binding protein